MRRVYHLLALLGLIFLFAAGGMAGFLFSTGRLNAERLGQIGQVLRGEYPRPVAAATQPASRPAPPPMPSRAEIARLQAQKELIELLSERARQELDQRRALNQQIQLDVTRKLEQIEARGRQFQEEKKKTAEQANMGGFEKELEWFSTIDPKKAKDLLIGRKEADAALILTRLEPNRVKRIVDACKTPEEMSWIGRILNQLHVMEIPTAGVEGPAAAAK